MCSKTKESDTKALNKLKRFDPISLAFRETVDILNTDEDNPLITKDNRKCGHLIDSLARIFVALVEASSSDKATKETNMGIEDCKIALAETEPKYIFKNMKEFYKQLMTKPSVKKDAKSNKSKKEKKAKKSRD
jgi:hypothetical protein